ncbi:MAG: hypothetical protein ACP5IL_08170 [Syntrophobacteraceae bacterium]
MKEISHLDEKQIIEAVIDESGLPGMLRGHLSACPACRARKEGLQESLARLGALSCSDIPPVFRKPTLKTAATPRGWTLRPALVLLASLALLFLFLTPMTVDRDRVFSKAVVYREMLQDQKFMAEVQSLEENPLPSFYRDISGPVLQRPDTPGPGAKLDVVPASGGGLQNG